MHMNNDIIGTPEAKNKEAAKKIKDFWESRVLEHGSDCRATLGEVEVRMKEIRTIKKYISPGQKIIDIGCGNGFSTISWARELDAQFTGIDYVEKMVETAHSALKTENPDVQSRVNFQTGDLNNLDFDPCSFDVVITERCLQNLPSFALQLNAIVNICKILKRNGLFLMLECSKTSVDKINSALLKISRKPIDPIPWHNLFFQDDQIIRTVPQNTSFKLVTIDKFASNYIFVTRILPRIFYRALRKTRLDYLLWRLPQIGDWGYFKLFVWRKST